MGGGSKWGYSKCLCPGWNRSTTALPAHLRVLETCRSCASDDRHHTHKIKKTTLFSGDILVELTAKEEPGSRAHAPLALVHAGCHGAVHLHADVGHLLGFQRPHHDHVDVAELIAPHVLEADSGGP